MEQQRAFIALETYLALAKSASSPRAAADLVVQATSSPNTFIFAELLQKPNIQALAQSPEYCSHLRLLEVFAWGTLADYKAAPGLPSLNANQRQKLLTLSLLPLCASPSTLGYASLQSALSLPTSRDLEQLVTTAIYTNLLQAHLDPLHQIIRVTSVAPLRDLSPGSVLAMTATLEEWQGRCAQTLSGIEDEIARIKSRAADEKSREVQDQAILEDQLGKTADRLRKELLPGPIESGKSGGSMKSFGGLGQKWGNVLSHTRPKRSAPNDQQNISFDDEMDVDDDIVKAGSRSTKRKGLR